MSNRGRRGDGSKGSSALSRKPDPSPAVDRVAVVSSVVRSVGYTPEAVLEIEFQSGAVYRYFLVPRFVFAALVGARSKGLYLNRFIKGRFRYTRL